MQALCPEDRSGALRLAWLSDPEVRTGTSRLVPDTGAPPDLAHHSPPPWPSQELHIWPRHLPCAGVALVTKEMAARVEAADAP